LVVCTRSAVQLLDTALPVGKAGGGSFVAVLSAALFFSTARAMLLCLGTGLGRLAGLFFCGSKGIGIAHKGNGRGERVANTHVPVARSLEDAIQLPASTLKGSQLGRRFVERSLCRDLRFERYATREFGVGHAAG
jgi:hypothetical protein